MFYILYKKKENIIFLHPWIEMHAVIGLTWKYSIAFQT